MRLLLHVGHGKTGSSFLQSWLALNAPVMWQTKRLLYPEKCPLSGVADQRARQGLFSMGNGFVLEAGLKRCSTSAQRQRWLKKLIHPSINESQMFSGLVFSSEPWVRRLPHQIDGLLAIADAWGVETIELWLLVRDPLDHACSVYAQMVKRHGFTGALNDWLEVYDFPRILLQFLELVEGCDGRFVLRTDHYGRRRKEILALMQRWLDLDSSIDWNHPDNLSVNRSLTSDELLLMRLLNQRFGEKAACIGERLVNHLPGLAAAELRVDCASKKAFQNRWSTTIDSINHYLPIGEKLCLDGQGAVFEDDIKEGNDDPKINILPEQLDCLLDGLGEISAHEKFRDRPRLLGFVDGFRESWK